MLVQASKILGAGMATVGLTGAGVGIGTVFGALVLGAVSYTHLTLPTNREV